MIKTKKRNSKVHSEVFAVPVAPAPRRPTPRRKVPPSSLPHSSAKKPRIQSSEELSSCSSSKQDTASSLLNFHLEHATISQSEPGICSSYNRENNHSIEVHVKGPCQKQPLNASMAPLNRFNGIQQAKSSVASITQPVAKSQSSLGSGFTVSNELEARILCTLSAASDSCFSFGDGSVARGLLLVRGIYVRQRDVRALLAPRVHPALLDSVLTTVIPLYVATSSLAELAAAGIVMFIEPNEDPTEPLMKLPDLLAALSKLSLKLGLEF